MKKYIIYTLILVTSVLVGTQSILADSEEVLESVTRPTVIIFERDGRTVISGANSQAAGVMWTAQHADDCTAYGDWPAGNIPSGSKQPTSGGVIIPTDGVSQYAGKFQLTFIMRCTGPGGTSSDFLRLEIDRPVKQPVFISPPDGVRIQKEGEPVALIGQINRFYDIGAGQVIEVSINNGSWQAMNPTGLNFEYPNIQNLSAGTYIWKLRANRNGETGPETTPRSFTVHTPELPSQPKEESNTPLPISPASITVTVQDNEGNSVPGAIVTINPGNSFPANHNPTTFPVNPGFPYSIAISGYDLDTYSLNRSSDGRTVRGEVRVDYQVSSENNNRKPMDCGSSQERCKQVLNHWMHGDSNRTANPSRFNNFISHDQSDDSFTFIFNKSNPRPVLDSLSVSPSTVKSNEPVTISWTGKNLVFCDTALSKNPSNALNLPLWFGRVPSTAATGGSISLTAPVVSQATTYRFGLSCGENVEAQIDKNDTRKAPTLSILPKMMILLNQTQQSVFQISQKQKEPQVYPVGYMTRKAMGFKLKSLLTAEIIILNPMECLSYRKKFMG